MQAAEKATEPKMTPTKGYRYRGCTGDCLAYCGSSARIWTEFSSPDEFTAGFMAIIVDEEMTKDICAAKVEEYLLEQATKAEVLDVTSIRCTFTNPNL